MSKKNSLKEAMNTLSDEKGARPSDKKKKSPLLDTLGADDLVDPAAIAAKQVYDQIKARRSFVGKRPPPLSLRGLTGATVAGVLSESATQQALNATRGGEASENPYVANLERLGSRVVGGATSGAILAKSPAGVIPGAMGAMAVDAAQNLYEGGKAYRELVKLRSEEYDRERQEERKKGVKRLRSILRSIKDK